MLKITDRITILRNGYYIDNLITSRANIEEIVTKMVGSEISYKKIWPIRKTEGALLEVKNYSN